MHAISNLKIFLVISSVMLPFGGRAFSQAANVQLNQETAAHILIPQRVGIDDLPVISVFDHEEQRRTIEFPVLVAIWESGLVIRAENSGFAVGQVSPKAVSDAIAYMHQNHLLNERDYDDRIFVHTNSTAISIHHENEWFAIGSTHDFYERHQRDKYLTANGLPKTIDQNKTLAQMLLAEPEEYRTFRAKWQALRDAIDELSETADLYVGDLEFVMKHVAVKYDQNGDMPLSNEEDSKLSDTIQPAENGD